MDICSALRFVVDIHGFVLPRTHPLYMHNITIYMDWTRICWRATISQYTIIFEAMCAWMLVVVGSAAINANIYMFNSKYCVDAKMIHYHYILFGMSIVFRYWWLEFFLLVFAWRTRVNGSKFASARAPWAEVFLAWFLRTMFGALCWAVI